MPYRVTPLVALPVITRYVGGMIHVACPSCDAKIKAEDRKAGTTVHCPSCKSAVQIPAKPPPSEPLAPIAAPEPMTHQDFSTLSNQLERIRKNTALMSFRIEIAFWLFIGIPLIILAVWFILLVFRVNLWPPMGSIGP